MDIEFELTVKVKGSSLEEIDNGLIQAASQRLLSRMTNMPTISVGDNKASGHDLAKASHPQKLEDNAHKKAFHTVYVRKGHAVAQEILGKFGCTTVSDLPKDKIESFVQTCNEVLEAK